MSDTAPKPRKRVTSKPVKISVTPQSPPSHPEADHPDESPKYGKPGGKVRTFTLLSNPTVDPDGVTRYDLYEVGKPIPHEPQPYTKIEPRMTAEEVGPFVAKNGQWAQ